MYLHLTAPDMAPSSAGSLHLLQQHSNIHPAFSSLRLTDVFSEGTTYDVSIGSPFPISVVALWL